MPQWLQSALSHLTEVEAFLTFMGSLLLACVPIYFKVRAEVRRNQQAMLSVPPTACPQPDARASETEAEQAHVALRRAQWRIKDLELDLSRVGEDHGRTAWALRAATVECTRLWALVADLEDRLREARSSAVVTADNRPTPKRGMLRAKDEEE